VEVLPVGRTSFVRRSYELRAAPRIAGHVLFAGAFFYVLQRFVLDQSHETGVIWAVAGGGGAALLAWLQHRRGG
jgi:hypothetical protein